MSKIRAEAIWSPEILSSNSPSFLPIASPSTTSRKCYLQETGGKEEADGWKRGWQGGGRWWKPSAKVKGGERQGWRPLVPSGSPGRWPRVDLATVSLFPEPCTLCPQKISKFLMFHSSPGTGWRSCDSQGHSLGISRTQENKTSTHSSGNPPKLLSSHQFPGGKVGPEIAVLYQRDAPGQGGFLTQLTPEYLSLLICRRKYPFLWCEALQSSLADTWRGTAWGNLGPETLNYILQLRLGLIFTLPQVSFSGM